MTKYRDETAASQSAIHRRNLSQSYCDQQHLPLKQLLIRKKLIDHCTDQTAVRGNNRHDWLVFVIHGTKVITTSKKYYQDREISGVSYFLLAVLPGCFT
mgnify:CR=1 FL=1